MQTDFTSNNGSINPKFSSDSNSFSPNFTSNGGSLTVSTDSNTQTIPIKFNVNPTLNVDFGSAVMIDQQGGNKQIYYGSTEYWNRQPDLVGERGSLYIYKDWMVDEEGRLVAGIKVGDGETLLIEQPAIDQLWQDHINDMIRHITPDERIYWNNKVSCDYMEEVERIIFSR